MDTLAMADQQKTYINQLSADTGCRVEVIPRAMTDLDGIRKK